MTRSSRILHAEKHGIKHLNLVEEHHSFMHRHLHGDSASAAFLHTILHADNSRPVAEGAVKLDFFGLLVTLATHDPFAAGINNEEPATKFEDPLTVILKLAQAHDIMFDVATGTFEGKCFQGHVQLKNVT